MTYRQALPFLGIVLMLVGCVRTSPDSFDTVGSQDTGEVIAVDPTEDTGDVVVIDPNDDTDADAVAEAETEPTATTRIVVAPTEDSEADNEDDETDEATTVPRNATGADEPDDTVQVTSTPQIIPTATEIEFITPVVQEEVEQPTSVPTEESIEPTLQPTPTGEAGAEAIELGDCDYEVQPNDNLFRIAINNDVSLDALLVENGLTEASVIQPGQVLSIPNCNAPDPIEDESADTDTSTAATGADLPEECTYEIVANDTLFQIALDNDVELDDLLAENDLSETAVIQIGQVLNIPLPQCDFEASAESAEDTITETDGTDDATTSTDGGIIYVVDEDDTLLSIAQTYGVTPNDIIQANTIPDPNNLTPGQELVIPTDN